MVPSFIAPTPSALVAAGSHHNLTHGNGRYEVIWVSVDTCCETPDLKLVVG